MGKKKAKKRGGGGKAAGATPAPEPEPAPAPALRGFWDGTLAPTGDAPSPRGGHSATVLGSLLYVFGGADRTPATHGDLHVLDIAGGKPLGWRQVAKPPPDGGAEWPEPRTDHAAAAAAGLVWVTGGQDPVGRAEAGCDSQYLPFEVWTLQPGAVAEGGAAAEDGAAAPKWTLRECDGAPPCARASHGMVLAGDGQTLAVFGGGGDEGPLADLHLLDTATCVWSQLLLAPATAPAPREMHACFCLPASVGGDEALATAAESGAELVVMGGRGASGVLGTMETCAFFSPPPKHVWRSAR